MSKKNSRPRARDKGTPHYNLNEFKEILRNENTAVVTDISIEGANKLELSRYELIEIVLNLKSSDFYKSMTHYLNYKLWQDVYRPFYKEKRLYVKIQIVDDKAVVVDFKEA